LLVDTDRLIELAQPVKSAVLDEKLFHRLTMLILLLLPSQFTCMQGMK